MSALGDLRGTAAASDGLEFALRMTLQDMLFSLERCEGVVQQLADERSGGAAASTPLATLSRHTDPFGSGEAEKRPIVPLAESIAARLDAMSERLTLVATTAAAASAAGVARQHTEAFHAVATGPSLTVDSVGSPKSLAGGSAVSDGTSSASMSQPRAASGIRRRTAPPAEAADAAAAATAAVAAATAVAAAAPASPAAPTSPAGRSTSPSQGLAGAAAAAGGGSSMLSSAASNLLGNTTSSSRSARLPAVSVEDPMSPSGAVSGAAGAGGGAGGGPGALSDSQSVGNFFSRRNSFNVSGALLESVFFSPETPQQPDERGTVTRGTMTAFRSSASSGVQATVAVFCSTTVSGASKQLRMSHAMADVADDQCAEARCADDTVIRKLAAALYAQASEEQRAAALAAVGGMTAEKADELLLTSTK